MAIDGKYERLVVLTGASRGIGQALARIFSGTDHHVVSIGRSAPGLPVDQHISTDLAKPESLATVLKNEFAETEAEAVWFFDVAASLPLARVSDEVFWAGLDEAMRISCQSPLLIGGTLRKVARKAQGELTIVHLTSGAARRAIAGWGGYCMAKAAAAIGWNVFALEEKGVHLHLVDPGAVDTDMQANLRHAGDPMAAEDALLQSADEAAQSIISRIGMPR